MKAIIYTRFSPQRNGSESASCEVQEAYCEELAAKKEWKVDGIFEDREKSGGDEARPGLWAAIDKLETDDVLLVLKLDRLARNLYLMERIRLSVAKRGARIVAVQGDIEGDTAESVMVRQILAAVAEYERKLIVQRTRAAMLHHQRSGRSMSSKPPYGYSIDGDRLVEVEVEQGAIQYIRKLWDADPDTLVVVRAMNVSEYCTRTGRSWVRRDVERIVSNMKGETK